MIISQRTVNNSQTSCRLSEVLDIPLETFGPSQFLVCSES